MAVLQPTHTSILNSNAQLLVFPVNTAGVVLDPVLTRAKTLFPGNYRRYHRACRDGSLSIGSCLLNKLTREQVGLGISSNGNQPSYIANLVISNHPYHPVRTRWLTAALIDLQQQMMPLIRYQGIRRVALLARPLISGKPRDIVSNQSDIADTLPLDWYADTLPLLTEHLQDLPKFRIDIHLPKSINL
ncbi:hypothetical protein ACT3QR_03380 [Psychrobacter sp. AOP7-B1-25]|uniref:hypothetical protein n=1 Tax=Psychrobacter sp. AOP7-B1-25 TaxID=3457644 RepID=UPI00402B44EF